MAHVKHPENQHEAIPGHHLAEEGDLGYSRRSPVVLHSWNRNDPRVDHHGQESLELCDGDGIPLQKATVLLQFALSPQPSVGQSLQMHSCERRTGLLFIY